MDKEYEVHMYIMEYYSVIKMNEISPFATQTDLEDIKLSEIRQRQILYVEPKDKTNEQRNKRETDS